MGLAAHGHGGPASPAILLPLHLPTSITKVFAVDAVGRMPQGNIVPHFARPAFLPSKEGGLEGREFVE